MQIVEIAPGLLRWTSPHPSWKDSHDWPEDVGCVLFESDSTVLIDPLVPDDQAEWELLDRRITNRARPVRILLTAPWHRRSATILAHHYGVRVWADPYAARRLDFETTSGPLPRGVELFRHGVGNDPQVAFFLRPVRALVVAEFFMGTNGGLTFCPPPHFDAAQRESLRAELRRILDLPLSHILVSHGEPVLASGREAVEAALTA